MRSSYSLAFRSSPGTLAVWSFDLILDLDGWIVRSSAPAPALGDPGARTSVCTGWASGIVLLWTGLVPFELASPLLIIWNQLPW
ncbi:hypothetical protein TNIN_357311 [Trichonephila inaurata madagascariensis]|uniref:Uncharacterized protein n=1 Tax=Trichonephila inaurata madagascariensis TaxID=2747483 RepID=A0A8X6JXP7_9ARAC|nr:hypothetical protein TNIN_357311 [Trichonephila inaurata madagascariensis]